VLNFDELVWGENGWTELGEELLDPHVESLLFDQEIKAVVNHDSGKDNAGFLALHGFFVHLSIGEPVGFVEKGEVGSIGSATSSNQIVHHFIFKLGPFCMCLLDDTVDLGQQKSILFVLGFGLGTRRCSA